MPAGIFQREDASSQLQRSQHPPAPLRNPDLPGCILLSARLLIPKLLQLCKERSTQFRWGHIPRGWVLLGCCCVAAAFACGNLLDERVTRSGCSTLYFGLHLAIVSGEILPWPCPQCRPRLGTVGLGEFWGRSVRAGSSPAFGVFPLKAPPWLRCSHPALPGLGCMPAVEPNAISKSLT